MKRKCILFAALLLMLSLLCAGCGEKEAAPGHNNGTQTAAQGVNEGTPVVEVKTSGDYLYIVHKDGTAEIMRYTGETAERTVPDTLDGHPVTGIGDWAFATCTSLTGISLPEGLICIGDEAFSGCYALTSITIPDSVTERSVNPFVGCYDWTDIRVSPDHPVFAVIDYVLFNKAEKKLVCYPYAFKATEHQVPGGFAAWGILRFTIADRWRTLHFRKG